MAKRQMIIEIDEQDYKDIKDFRTIYDEFRDDIAEAIANGIVLPKNHGRLKDIDAFITKVKADRKHSAYLRSWTADDVLNALNNSYTPTIIEGSDSK